MTSKRQGKKRQGKLSRRRWSDLEAGQRAALVAVAAVEVALTATAAVDLTRRPSGQIRGGKAMWWPLIFVQPVGPITYLVWGRRR